jgi:hypothetical protein
MCYNGCCTSLFCEDDDIPECELCHGAECVDCPLCFGNFDCEQCVDGFVPCECSIDDTEPERQESTNELPF